MLLVRTRMIMREQQCVKSILPKRSNILDNSKNRDYTEENLRFSGGKGRQTDEMIEAVENR
jgi:hypothetical protein